MVKNYELIWARNHAGITQQQASEMMGVNRVTFARWEINAVQVPAYKMAKFLRLIDLKPSDIPAEMEPPSHIDGERSTPYLPMRLQHMAQSDWPAADTKRWEKCIEVDAKDLVTDWLGYFGDIESRHDEVLEDRGINLLWVGKGWMTIDRHGKGTLTDEGKIQDQTSILALYQ